MSEHPEHVKVAIAIADRLAADQYDWSRVRFDSHAYPWFGRFLAEMATMIGPVAIEYVSSNFEFKESGIEFVAAVFTRDLFVISRGSGPTAAPKFRTSTVARKTLVEVQSRGGADVFSQDWPGALEVGVVFERGEAVSLPLGGGGRSRSAVLEKFVPSLLADLSG